MSILAPYRFTYRYILPTFLYVRLYIDVYLTHRRVKNRTALRRDVAYRHLAYVFLLMLYITCVSVYQERCTTLCSF
jgi:hypothetical protein